MSTFWPQILSKNFDKGSETRLGLPQSSGSPFAGIFRRHLYIMAATPELCLEHTQLTWQLLTDLGFLGNLTKSVLTPTQQTEYLGFLVNFIEMTLFNGKKTVTIKARSRVPAEIKPSGKDVGMFLGLLPVNSSSHCSGPSSFQKITGRYDKSLKRLKGETRLLECSPSFFRSQKRTGMVEGLLKNEQWQKHFVPRKTRHNIHRCFQARVEGTFKPSKNRGSMNLGVKGRYTHKYAGIKSGFSCFASFSSPTETAAHTVWHRQQNGSNLHQPIGGNPFTVSDISSLRNVEF